MWDIRSSLVSRFRRESIFKELSTAFHVQSPGLCSEGKHILTPLKSSVPMHVVVEKLEAARVQNVYLYSYGQKQRISALQRMLEFKMSDHEFESTRCGVETFAKRATERVPLLFSLKGDEAEESALRTRATTDRASPTTHEENGPPVVGGGINSDAIVRTLEDNAVDDCPA